MRLLELKLRDFGIYRGSHTFDLRPRQGPIVLFGGKNGAGKTTLLEAIRLCLYGARALGNRVGKRMYEEYIVSRIHHQRGAASAPQYAEVMLRFEYAQFGNLQTYEVTRGWEKKSNRIKEQLVVRRDGDLLSGMAEDRWQDFIEDIIPSRVAELFFFDGEKIQSLATDSLSEQTLGEEIKRLLDLNLVERLQADLDIYLYRQRKENAVPELVERLETMRKNRDEIEARYQAKRQDRAQTQARLDHIHGKIEGLERKISRESSGFALAREELKTELARIEAELALAERELQTLAAGLLPFTLVPELTQQLKSQLLAEAHYQQWQASQKIVKPKVREIRDTFRSNAFWQQINGNLSPEERASLIEKLDKMLDTLSQPPDTVVETSLLHQISEPERVQLLSWIEQAESAIPRQVHLAGQRLEEFARQREEITLRLRQVPEDDILKPLIVELNNLHQNLGEIEAQATREDQELRSLGFQRQEAQRKLRKAYEALRGGEALERRLEMVTKVQTVLDKFLARITREKISELERLVVSRFNDLSRKPDLVREVQIDPTNFNITLIGQDGELVPKSRLSAGEKQIFAIAMLWALRQLSGRPFPIVIDTPLGRLDSDHRANLVQNYFPYISHQVILFSTDTEVDQEYFQALKPHISHAYHLEYDPNKGATFVSEGYFWSEASYAVE